MDWYALDSLSGDAQAELDLLSATFPELGFDAPKSAAVLSVPAREGSDGAARAVAADLSLHLPADYPSEACMVTVVRTRGGVDDTELQKQLQKIADEAAEDEVPCLYQLIEDARDVMGQAASAKHALLSAPELLKGLAAAVKTRLASSKARLKTAERAVERAGTRNSAATTALSETVAAQAGKGERVKDTPCPVCRAVVPFALVESWVTPLLQGSGGGASADADAEGGQACAPFEALDATTIAYIHSVQQQVVRGLRRQLGAGGVTQEAVADAEAVLQALQTALAGDSPA